MTSLTSTPHDALRIGQEAMITRLCRAEDLIVFSHASGSLNPLHLPDHDGDGDGRVEALAPAAWIAALIAGVVGNQLPGPGTRYRSQNLRFLGQAQAGDTLQVSVRVAEKLPDHAVRLAVMVTRPEAVIAQGEVVVIAPMRHHRFEDLSVP